MTNSEFFKLALRHAKSARGRGAPINPHVAAAQACLETGYGRHIPGSSNNVLGIKAGTNWNGPTVNARTHEYNGSGERYGTAADFRAYPSMADCFIDYGALIKRLWWFQDAEDSKDDARKFLNALMPIYSPDGTQVIEPGYATDPKYVDKVLSILMDFAPSSIDPDPYSEGSLIRVPFDWFQVIAGEEVVNTTEASGVFSLVEGVDGKKKLFVKFLEGK